MNINESLRDWIAYNIDIDDELAAITLVTMGETGDLAPPFLGIYETGSEAYKQDNVQLPGVSSVEITCEMHTVPAEDGTSAADEREFRRMLYDILGDRFAIEWMTGRNGWQLFDIRLAAPTTEVNEGRRISKWILSIVAAPI